MSRDSLQRPIEELADTLRRFMRVQELRLLCVEAQGRVRKPAIQTVLGFEHHADNRAPVFPLQIGNPTDGDLQWGQATQALRDLFEQQREAGSPLAEIEEHAAKRRFASADFSVQLLQCAHAVQEPAQGLLLVLLVKAPQIDAQWLDRVREFATSPELAAVRFIVVSSPSSEIEPWLERFPKATAVHHQCEVDNEVAVKELTLQIDREEARGAGFRGAWPKGVAPPPIPLPSGSRASTSKPVQLTVPPDPTRSPASAAGGSIVAADRGGAAAAEEPPPPSVKTLVQRAAVAIRAGDGPEAIRQQAAARDLCLEQGDIREAVRMETMLGAYMSELEQPKLAADVLEKAARRAYDAQEYDLAAQAFLAQGSVHDADGNARDAVRAYRYAIDNGAEADEPALVLEAYWRAGQTALRTGLELDCLALYADGVAYAREQPPKKLRQTRAKGIADELCGLLSKHRRYSEARLVERTAEGFSAGSAAEGGPGGTG